MNDLIEKFENTLATLAKSAEGLRKSSRPAMHKAASRVGIVREMLAALRPEIEDLAARRFSQELGNSASLPWWAGSGPVTVSGPRKGDSGALWDGLGGLNDLNKTRGYDDNTGI